MRFDVAFPDRYVESATVAAEVATLAGGPIALSRRRGTGLARPSRRTG